MSRRLTILVLAVVLVLTLLAGFVAFAPVQASEKYPRIWASGYCETCGGEDQGKWLRDFSFFKDSKFWVFGSCPTCKGWYWTIYDIDGQTLPQDALSFLEVDDPAYDATEADNELHLLWMTVGNIKLPVDHTRAQWNQDLPAGKYLVTARYQVKHPSFEPANLKERFYCLRKYGRNAFAYRCGSKPVVVTETRTVKATVNLVNLQ